MGEKRTWWHSIFLPAIKSWFYDKLPCFYSPPATEPAPPPHKIYFNLSFFLPILQIFLRQIISLNGKYFSTSWEVWFGGAFFFFGLRCILFINTTTYFVSVSMIKEITKLSPCSHPLPQKSPTTSLPWRLPSRKKECGKMKCFSF